MEKLQRMTRAALDRMYYEEFGLPADHQKRETVIVALFLGKRIKYLTEEELSIINEH